MSPFQYMQIAVSDGFQFYQQAQEGFEQQQHQQRDQGGGGDGAENIAIQDVHVARVRQVARRNSRKLQILE